MKTFILSDLCFGDAGKGTVTSFLCQAHDIDLVVRYNGGAQACHTVDCNGIKHQFHMFGSGTLQNVPTYLSEYVLVDFVIIYSEGEELKQKLGKECYKMLHLNSNCLVTTSYHKYVNRAREESRDTRHGSCGLGIGATMEANLQNIYLKVYHLNDILSFRQRLLAIRDWAISEIKKTNNKKWLEEALKEEEFEAQIKLFPYMLQKCNILDSLDKNKNMVFEGSQGVLLDEDWGFHPNTTWSRTTSANALTILKDIGIERDQVENIGIIRAYQTRHGAGPLPTETDELEIRDCNNPRNQWQGKFRVGYLDIPLTKYAIHANQGIDSLAYTCCDQIRHIYDYKVAVSYDKDIIHNRPGDLDYLEQLGKSLYDVNIEYIKIKPNACLVYEVSEMLDVPAYIVSNGPRTEDKSFL